MTALATTLRRLPEHINVRRGPSLIELFDYNRLQGLLPKPEFTFELTDPSDALDFLFHGGKDFWTTRTEEVLQGQILYCEPQDNFGRMWQIKVRFSVAFNENEDGVFSLFNQEVETLIDYSVSSRTGKPHDKHFTRKFMRWLEPAGGVPGGLYFNGRQVARIAEPKQPNEALLRSPIEELELGVRNYNALKRIGVETIGDLVDKTEYSLATIPNLGKASIDEVKTALKKHGFTLKK
jgi:hypothetical protein